MSKNPYEALGVSKEASQADITKAFRKLAKKYHPDLNPGNPNAEKQFKEINEAYEQIGTPEARQKFDRGEFEQREYAQGGGPFGQHRQGPFYYKTQDEGGRYSFSFSGQEDFEDLFSDLFQGRTGSQGRGAGRRAGQRKGPRGEDQYYKMEVDFKDAVLGAEKDITLPNQKTLRVKIPPGIQSGAKLRFSGQGSPGLAGGEAGDAYVEVVVKPSPYFKRVGNDLEIEIPISLQEALLGGEIKVPTVEGSILLKIPAHANSGTRLRARGKGVKAPDGQRGDQINILKVELPPQADSELKDFIKKWSKDHPYNPRPSQWT